MTEWGRSRRVAPGVAAGLMVMLTAACASAPAEIPSAKPSPSAAPTTIAPGVRVNPSQLRLPPYSVSTSNPLPAGTSARMVVEDFVADNLIENSAIERGDAALLKYADAGGMLSVNQALITSDQAKGSHFLTIDDTVSSLVLGRETDPNDPSAVLALNVEGVEKTQTRSQTGSVGHKVADFHVLVWVIWSPTLSKYLRCDVSVL